jgi:hypothetical protein
VIRETPPTALEDAEEPLHRIVELVDHPLLNGKIALSAILIDSGQTLVQHLVMLQ